jgi:hypothetical protein
MVAFEFASLALAFMALNSGDELFGRKVRVADHESAKHYVIRYAHSII